MQDRVGGGEGGSYKKGTGSRVGKSLLPSLSHKEL